MAGNGFTTDKQIQALKPKTDSKQTDYFHATEPGFGIRITSRKKTWFIMYSVHENGKRKRKRLTLSKTYPDLSLADARTEAIRKRAEILDGIDPAADKKASKEAPTFKDICDVYLTRHAEKHKRPSSIAQDKRMINGQDLTAWHYRKAHEITGRDIINLIDDVSDRAPVQANRLKALIHKIFKVAIERREAEKLLTSNPCAGLPSPAKEKPSTRWFDDAEIKTLWSAFDSCRQHLPVIFKLLLLTGQRSGEVFGLRWEEIDFDAATWSLSRDRTKNGRPHIVPLTKKALEILKAQYKKTRKGEYAFPPTRNAKSGHLKISSKDITAVKLKSEINDFRPHHLRRTVSTYMGKLEISRFIQDRLTNHVDATMGGIYDQHDYLKEKRAALEKWERKLDQILTGKKAKIISIGGAGK